MTPLPVPSLRLGSELLRPYRALDLTNDLGELAGRILADLGAAQSANGQHTFRRLVETADFVLESFPPGYLQGLGLGYAELSKINPRLVLTSITPFAHGRMGNRSVRAAPHGVFPVQGNDAWIAIACETDVHWQVLVEVMDSPAWPTDPASAHWRADSSTRT
ncbi:MAG: CoA transferase [Chloroflexi bacterium]|nr:CoA transferase [Chloroflexota bacterium]MBV9597552.1 CoA transferase [Chloroflexota bacterium]